MAQKPTITSLNGFYQLICFKKTKLKVVFWYILAINGAYVLQWAHNLIGLVLVGGGY